MTEWKKVNGKLCKEMSQESKDKLHAYEIEQSFRYPPLELPESPILTNTLYKNKYIENHTVSVDEKSPPKPKRDWRRDVREW